MNSKKTKIKAIVFDMGGVLIDLHYDNCVNAYKSIGFNNITDYLDPYHQKGIYGEMEAGKVSAEEFYDFAISQSTAGTTKQDIDACFKSFYSGPSKEKADYLIELKKRGYPIYMLSNNNPIMMRICDKDFSNLGIGISSFFDKAFISSTMKLMKPGQEIYLETIRQIGCSPEEILFIDDSKTNVEAARKEGITTIEYIPGEDLKKVIEPYLK